MSPRDPPAPDGAETPPPPATGVKLKRVREQLIAGLPGVYAVVYKQALTGVPWACRLLLEHVEKLEEQAARERESVISFTWSPPKDAVADVAPAAPATADEADGTC